MRIAMYRTIFLCATIFPLAQSAERSNAESSTALAMQFMHRIVRGTVARSPDQ